MIPLGIVLAAASPFAPLAGIWKLGMSRIVPFWIQSPTSRRRAKANGIVGGFFGLLASYYRTNEYRPAVHRSFAKRNKMGKVGAFRYGNQTPEAAASTETSNIAVLCGTAPCVQLELPNGGASSYKKD
jgi:hypothetical protein